MRAAITVAMCVSEKLAGGRPIKVNQKELVRSQSRWMLCDRLNGVHRGPSTLESRLGDLTSHIRVVSWSDSN